MNQDFMQSTVSAIQYLVFSPNDVIQKLYSKYYDIKSLGSVRLKKIKINW